MTTSEREPLLRAQRQVADAHAQKDQDGQIEHPRIASRKLLVIATMLTNFLSTLDLTSESRIPGINTDSSRRDLYSDDLVCAAELRAGGMDR
jgi:hypothetical protein